MICGGVTIALLWGDLATRLYVYPGRFSMRYALMRPSRPIHYIFILYTIPLVATLVAIFALPGAIADAPVNATYVLSGVNYTAVGLGAGFLALGSTVIVAFVSYPFGVLVQLRSQLKDPEVRYALRVIAVCFGIISALMFAVNTLDTFGVSISNRASSNHSSALLPVSSLVMTINEKT